MNVLSMYSRTFLDAGKSLSEKIPKLDGAVEELKGLGNLDGVVEGLGTREISQVRRGGISFADMVSTEIDKVNSAQVKADDLTNEFMVGEVDNLHSVMIATEEARISLELAVQVRNKCIEAYKEINNMQL